MASDFPFLQTVLTYDYSINPRTCSLWLIIMTSLVKCYQRSWPHGLPLIKKEDVQAASFCDL